MAEQNPKIETDRRAFLTGAGKYALVVPPAMTFLLSTTMVSEAVAVSNQTQTYRERGSNERSSANEGGSFNMGGR